MIVKSKYIQPVLTVVLIVFFRIRALFNNYDIVIMSYDIIRNDIDELEPLHWNYCILDEGHIIKNGKTKITKAIKTLKSNHRLILSGTPIQVSNNSILKIKTHNLYIFRIMCLNYGHCLTF
jgi:SNF2 family DNA or RNA helicase